MLYLKSISHNGTKHRIKKALPRLTDLGQLIGDADVCENHTARVGTNSFSMGQHYVETLKDEKNTTLSLIKNSSYL